MHTIQAFLTVVLCGFVWLTIILGFVLAEEITIYDKDWQVKRRTQDGTIHDRNWRVKGHIEDGKVYDMNWKRSYRFLPLFSPLNKYDYGLRSVLYS